MNIPNRLNPALVSLKHRELLSKSGSSKNTYHVVLELQNSNLQFEVGDSLGIYAQNDPILVQHLLDAMGAKGSEQIKDPRSGQEVQVKDFLTHKANLSRLSSSFLKLLHEHVHIHEQKDQLETLLKEENKTLLRQFLTEHDPLNVLKEFRGSHLPLQEMCAQFSPLLPRFYSVASSPKLHPTEVHLTVALSTFTLCGEQRFGVASHFLCHLAEPGVTQIPVYVQPAPHFRPPEDPTLPIIMIGPGTGVAPFRAFLQERLTSNANGKNWLFFGERNHAHDFFYGDYFRSLEENGHLKLALAFSRDQEEKIYVQHRMYEHRQDLWDWISSGAHIYVCGDADQMAKDVDAMLQQIGIEVGKMSKEESTQFFKQLRKDKHYHLDVY